MRKVDEVGAGTPIAHQVLIPALVQLGLALKDIAQGGTWSGHASGITEAEHGAFTGAIRQAGVRNGWFTEENVRHALGSIAHMLREDVLREWLAGYPELERTPQQPRNVGLVLAGNLPLVGFHDVLCVLVSGNRATVKYSAQDNVLLPDVLELLERLLPEVRQWVRTAEGKLGAVDAVIATGSNNTARYFAHYFKEVPHIIRRNRVGLAVLDGSETDAELAALGEDVFRYFGLGCRNVSKLYIPQDFDLDRLFGALYPWKGIVDHNKYANNYDYNKAVWLLERVDLIENGFLLLKEDTALASPVASLFYERYADPAEVAKVLRERKDEIQCVVGHGHLPFGTSQTPGPGDYADGVDTLRFLIGIAQGSNS